MLKRLSIRSRILLLAGLLMSLASAIAGVGWYAISDISASLSESVRVAKQAQFVIIAIREFAGADRKAISMTSPLRWVVSFSSAYTLSQVRQAIAGKGERRPEHIRQFVVNALVTQLVITHTPGLAPLFTDLRYQLQTDSLPDLPKLPLTTITSGLPSFRPGDELILSATNFSGVPAFIELIDIDALSHLQDPLKARIDEVQAKAKAASDRLKARLEQIEQETDARIKALQEQAAKARGDAKAKLDARITELRADSQRRSGQLKEAWGLTKAALTP